MSIQAFIKSSPLKGKAICSAIFQALSDQVFSVNKLIAEIPSLKPADRGNCMEAIVLYTELNPTLFPIAVVPNLEAILCDNAPRVQWECARCIALLAPIMTVNWHKHINALLINAKQGGTVVRWSAAKALLAIYLSDLTTYAFLKLELETCIQLEEKNSIQKIYKQAFK